MNITRTGRGRPLLLVHGLGSTRRVWEPILDGLAREREAIAIDLPGHNGAAAQADSGTFAGLARSLEAMLDEEGLAGTDMVGISLGGQLVLEMARRGKAGATVALDPGGFWAGWERTYLLSSLKASAWMLRGMRPALPMLARLPVGAALPIGQFGAGRHADLLAYELDAFARTTTLDALIDNIPFGPMQSGPAASPSGPVTIGWGRHDRVCLPVQAKRAAAAFAGARVHWFERSGHYPIWNEPEAALDLILASTGARA